MNESRFDKAAKTWDTAPRIKLAEAVFSAVKRNITFKEDSAAADFGAGTGLLTLAVAPLVKSVTAIDTSNEMLEVLKEKAVCAGIKNITSVHADIDDILIKNLRFDIIVSSMTLHHIKSTGDTVSLFYSILNKNGTIAIADLDKENGDFHPDNTGVFHFGFDRDDLKLIFEKAGFRNIRYDTAFIMERTTASEEMKNFPVFLLIAEKK